jgi:hypothetical protein
MFNYPLPILKSPVFYFHLSILKVNTTLPHRKARNDEIKKQGHILTDFVQLRGA